MSTITLYLAGPMPGKTDLNRQAFADAESELRDAGYDVINPHNSGVAERLFAGKAECEFAPEDLAAVLIEDLITIAERADGLALLDGWSASTGATVEHDFAKYCNIPCYCVLDWRWIKFCTKRKKTKLPCHLSWPSERLTMAGSLLGQGAGTEGTLSVPGYKDDAGKARFDLVPPEFLIAFAELFAIGANKYADRNWEKGMAWGRVFAAMMRHAWQWWAGERNDATDGQHHLLSVAWCAAVLYEYDRIGIGTDDRTISRAD